MYYEMSRAKKFDIDELEDDTILEWADRNVGITYEAYVTRELDADNIRNMTQAVNWLTEIIENNEYICKEFVDWVREHCAEEIEESYTYVEEPDE